MRILEGCCDYGLRALGHFLLLIAAPQCALTGCHRRAQAAPVPADMGEIRLSDRLRSGCVEPAPATDMVVVALRKDDLFDGMATDRAQPPEVFLGVKDDAGVHQHIALGR